MWYSERKDVKDLLENYSKEERQAHIDLTEPCDERGGNNTHFRGILANFLNTNIPTGSGLICAHACHNGKCSNPKHLYWATAKENYDDGVENGTNIPVHERMFNKYGHKNTSIFISKGHKKKMSARGGKANLGKSKSHIHKQNLSMANKGKTQKPSNKLTPEQAEEIRAKYQTSEYSYSDLSKEYGVGLSSIARIIKRVTYK